MERLNRKPFQGVTNIVRFNWHFYVIALIVVTAALFLKQFLPHYLELAATILVGSAIAVTVISLTISYYIYDLSTLYTLDWLDDLNIGSNTKLVTISAGFDETSSTLTKKYPGSDLEVFDFYDPEKHTEVSIERARKAYPVFPGTKTINTSAVPLKVNSTDHIFLILAAHEIRNIDERINFFSQLRNALKPEGKIIVVEHQRDLANFLAYNFGFFHFHSTNSWKKVFKEAQLAEIEELKLTPFISAFILKKNGITA